jgi:hypothetical protein
LTAGAGRRVRAGRGITVGALIAVAAASAIQVGSAAADPIGGAAYKGKARGDGRKVALNVSANGRVVGPIAIRFDSRCRQNGKSYTNKNTAIILGPAKVRGSGKFKAKDEQRYPGGSHASVAKGRFSRDGSTVKGRFSFHSTLSGSSVGHVKCSSGGSFRARTNATPEEEDRPAGPPVGQWAGTTAQGLEIRFWVNRGGGPGGIASIRFDAQVECVRDEGAPGNHSFTEVYSGGVLKGRVDGSSFEAVQESDRVRGRFEGKAATGVLSVTNYRNEMELAACSTPGEIAFTARPSDDR